MCVHNLKKIGFTQVNQNWIIRFEPDRQAKKELSKIKVCKNIIREKSRIHLNLVTLSSNFDDLAIFFFTEQFELVAETWHKGKAY